MTLLDEFQPVSRANPCPVCGRTKFCLVEKACPTNPAKVVCTKIESPKKWKDAGYLHLLRDDGFRSPPPRVRTVTIRPTRSPSFGPVAQQFIAAATEEMITGFASRHGLTSGSLERLGIGWATPEALDRLDTTHRGLGRWSFPMRDGEGKIVGIRLRTEAGFKYAIKGSAQGIFIPADLDAQDQLLIAEGPTDTAALLDLGFPAVGRPSCNSGERHVVTLVQRLGVRAVVIVADADEPGLHGAKTLASVLAAYVPDVRIIRPPDGVKDARAWKASCRTADAAVTQINHAIASAVPTRPVISSTKAGR